MNPAVDPSVPSFKAEVMRKSCAVKLDSRVPFTPATLLLLVATLLSATSCSRHSSTEPIPEPIPLPDIDDEAILHVLSSPPLIGYPPLTEFNSDNPGLTQTIDYIDVLSDDRFEYLDKWVNMIKEQQVEATTRWIEEGESIEVAWQGYYPDWELQFRLVTLIRPHQSPGDTISYEVEVPPFSSGPPQARGWLEPTAPVGRVHGLEWETTQIGFRHYYYWSDITITLVDSLEGGGSLRMWTFFGHDFRSGWDLFGNGWFATNDTSGVWQSTPGK